MQVFDQRIEVGVLRHDVNDRARLLLEQSADVVRNVHVDGVLAGARDLHVFGVCTQRLHGVHQLEGDSSLGLGGADKHLYAELASGERGEAVGLDVFEIDQDVVSWHV